MQLIQEFVILFLMLEHPFAIKKKLSLNLDDLQFIHQKRLELKKTFTDRKKIILFIGPCSIHNPQSALYYAKKLKALADSVCDKICIVMRTFIEKSRTGLGWPGFVHDPMLDNSQNLEKGIIDSRELLLEITKLRLPITMEMIDPWILPYFDDLLSWGFIGARSSTSQLHRKMVSGLDFPVGFKNGLDGDIMCCINSISVAKARHTLMFLDESGTLQTKSTRTNPFCHTTLRGAIGEVNYKINNIEHASQLQRSAGHQPFIVVDCAHGNSNKTIQGQIEAFKYLIENPCDALMGIMLESFLLEGAQTSPIDPNISITDPCIDFETTRRLINSLYQSLSPSPNVGACTR